jgi:hypothetical protein
MEVRLGNVACEWPTTPGESVSPIHARSEAAQAQDIAKGGSDMLRILTIGSCLLWLGGTSLAADSVQEVTLGSPAPDFTVTGIDGKDFRLSDKMANGKNIVLMFSRAHW